MCIFLPPNLNPFKKQSTPEGRKYVERGSQTEDEDDLHGLEHAKFIGPRVSVKSTKSCTSYGVPCTPVNTIR